MDLGLEGKIALVCAASRGLGLAVARELAAEGAQLAICARGADGLRAAHDAIAEVNGDGALGMVADVGVPDDLDALLDEVEAGFGRSPDIVVWNAGGPPSGPLLESAPGDVDAGIQLHLRGALHLFRRAVPPMVARGFGRVLAITSVAAAEPIVGLGISNAVRAGLHGVLKTLSHEVAASGVTVNAVMPGYTRTARLEALAQTQAQRTGRSTDAVLASMARTIPAGRVGRPEEFAAAVAFLASERASYINGVGLKVDGGFCRGLF